MDNKANRNFLIGFRASFCLDVQRSITKKQWNLIVLILTLYIVVFKGN